MAAAASVPVEDLGAVKTRADQNPLLTQAIRFQQKLLNNPCDPEALVALSLIALSSRQFDAAILTARAATEAAPQLIPAWVALGHALRANGNLDEAEASLTHALSIDGTDSLALVALGEFNCAAGDAERAIALIRLAVNKSPEKPDVHLALGHAFACAGRFADALSAYQKTLDLAPNHAEASFAAGYALMRLYRPDEAERAYRRALFLNPNFAAAWLNLGQHLSEQGRIAEAEAALRRSVELMPTLTTGWVNLANLVKDCGSPALANEFLHRAMQIDPARVETLVALTLHAHEAGNRPAASQWLNKALEAAPQNADVLNTHGILLHAAGRHEEALTVLAEAESHGSFSAISNCGNVLLDMGRTAEALATHRRAVERDPHHPGARYNLALTELRSGHWLSGWLNYGARWHFREVNRITPHCNAPRWDGDWLEGRSILLHAEQGLGDSIEFCRYAPLVAARNAQVTLEVQRPVARLIRSLAAAHSGAIHVIPRGEPRPPFDVECPLLSLPACFLTTTDTAPWFGPYLAAEPDASERRAAELRSHFGTDEKHLRIGLAWAGNPNYKADAARSMPLANYCPLLRALPEAQFISLQKGEAANQLASLPHNLHIYDGSRHDEDFADTAALAANLDLILTTDTAVAHLAGAMGLPVWLLLAHHADWRWMENRPDSPWYPTMRLFRQSKAGDWAGLLHRVTPLIDELIQSKSIR